MSVTRKLGKKCLNPFQVHTAKTCLSLSVLKATDKEKELACRYLFQSIGSESRDDFVIWLLQTYDIDK